MLAGPGGGAAPGGAGPGTAGWAGGLPPGLFDIMGEIWVVREKAIVL